MRITSGIHRGRKLVSPQGDHTRPTSDRARESIFNILRHGSWHEGVLEDADVLDVFAGTGALGLEALSQGAKHAVFIEQDGAAAKLCQSNIELLKETGRAIVLRQDALKLGQCPAYIGPRSLVFLDPPYGKNMGAQALAALASGGWLKKGAACVLEMSKQNPETIPPAFEVVDERIYGIAKIVFLTWAG